VSDRREREKRKEERLQEESKISSQDRRTRILQLAAGAVFLVVAVVLVLIVVNSASNGDSGDSNLEEVAEVNELLDGIPQQELVLGDPSAKVELIEFADLQCPYCRAYSENTLPQVIEKKIASGAAKLVYRNFPILGQDSFTAGAAAIAAGAQGRGWNFIELFYRNQGKEGSGYVTDEFLTSIAKGAGVKNIQQWNSDRESPKTIAKVEKTYEEAGSKFGFEGTPSFLARGPGTDGYEKVEYSESPASFEQAIDEAG